MGSILSIDKVVYGVEDLAEGRRFFSDWGLQELEQSSRQVVFETLEGSQVVLLDSQDESLPEPIESGPTVRQVIWAVTDDTALMQLEIRLRSAGIDVSRSGDLLLCTDPAGLSVGFRVAVRQKIDVSGVATNAYGRILRKDKAAPIYKSAQPVRLSHVVFFTDILDEHIAFYTEQLGFYISDSYPGEGIFLRCQAEGGHHDIFLINSPIKPRGLNHVSFMVRDIYEVFAGGIRMNSLGWETQIGPGRHPISSAIFWYMKCPCGALIEYYADEDYLSAAWRPREFKRTPENFAEWSIDGGIDATTRKQVNPTGDKL